MARDGGVAYEIEMFKKINHFIWVVGNLRMKSVRMVGSFIRVPALSG